MTPEEQEEHEAFVRRNNEETDIAEDTQMVSCLAIVVVAHVVAICALLAPLVSFPRWSAAVIGVPMVLAPKLYALWRRDGSSLPLWIHGRKVVGLERRQWLIIFAIVIGAGLLVQVLGPLALEAAAGW